MCVCVCVLSHYVHPLLSGLSFSPTDYCECVSSCDFFVRRAEQSAVCFITLSSERGWQVQTGRPHQKNPEGMNEKKQPKNEDKATLKPEVCSFFLQDISHLFPPFHLSLHLVFLHSVIISHVARYVSHLFLSSFPFLSAPFAYSIPSRSASVMQLISCVKTEFRRLSWHPSAETFGCAKHCYCSNPVSHIIVLARQDACWSHWHN